jgi:hypothetical protein
MILRLRAAIGEQLTAIVIALLVLGLIGGWITYTTYGAPGTTTVERPLHSWETTGQFTHSATVEHPNPVFPVGSTLQNRTIYFTRLSPQLNGTYSHTYQASEGGAINQTISLSLVRQAVLPAAQGENETILWQTTSPLERASVNAVEPGAPVHVPFSVNISTVRNQTELIRSQLGGAGGQVELFVHATVRFQGRINGETVHRTTTYTLPIAAEEHTYRLGSNEPTTDRHEATQTVRVPATYGPVRSYGGPLLLVTSSVALVVLAVAGSRGMLGLARAERELLAYQDDRDDFAEWISTIRLPDEAFELPEAEADSLAALVDLAIDTDTRVIEDPTGHEFYVVHNGFLYSYRPSVHPSEPRQRTESADDVNTPTDTKSSVTAMADDRPDAVRNSAHDGPQD